MKPKILLVDDRIENIIALEQILKEVDAELIRALSGNDAIALSLENEFAIILIDVQMPDMDGYETVEIMRTEEKNKFIPVLFISAIYSEYHYLIKGIETGAVDFLTKPIIPEILIGKVKVFLEYYQQKKLLEAHSATLAMQNQELSIINEKLQKSEEELRRTNFNKDQLFSIIAHDIRSPLHSLLSSYQILNDPIEPPSEDDKKVILATSYEMLNNLSVMVQELLDWSRTQSGFLKRENVLNNVWEVVSEIQSLYAEVLRKKSITLNLNVSKDDTIFADRFMVKSMIRNLISNAIKFSNAGSSIEVSSIRNHNQIKLTVADNGVGMNQEQIKHLFSFHERSSTPGTLNELGTGLGLVLVKDFAELNNGKLEIVSSPGNGTKITITMLAVQTATPELTN